MKARWLPLLLMALVGCQKPAEAPKPDANQPPKQEVKAEAPTSLDPTEIVLIRGSERVHVGDKAEDVYQKLLGGRSGGFAAERLPQGFDSPYQARTWQGADEGFGLISYKGAVACAMIQQSHTTQEHANEVRMEHQKVLGDSVQPEMIAGNNVTYYFWERDGAPTTDGSAAAKQRLMIMVLQTPRTGVFLATAMGDSHVMDALGMDPQHARDDQIAVDQMLSPQKS